MYLKNIALGLATAGALLFTACSTQYSDESLSLRKDSAFDESKITGDKTMYNTEMAGESKKFDRAFQDAPPMIPHDLEGMLPITIDNNSCTGCHDPAVAPSMGATPIPKSHFIDFRPKHNFDGKTFTKSIDNMKNEVSVKPISQLAGARFNCTQCHAPQTTGKLTMENDFKAAYTREDGANKSSWDEVILDNLETLKK